MTDFSHKSCLVFDHGLFPFIAQKLAESFGQVFYFSPWTGDGFPVAQRRQIGWGMPGVERVYSFWSKLPEVDLVVFTDVYTFDLVEHCRKLGIPTWGAGRSEALELERWETRRLIEAYGLPVVPAKLATGISELRRYLYDMDEAYVKAASALRSVGRGDTETFHHEHPEATEDWLDDLDGRLGIWKEMSEFVVEEPMPGCEVGYDGACVDGRYSEVALYGYEYKDKLYLGRVCPFPDLPESILSVLSATAPILRNLGCRGFMSNEIRVTKEGVPYLIDPTMRAGSPPSESYMELFTNWAEVIWAGAHGEVVDFVPAAPYVAQVVLKSTWLGEDRSLPVYFPDDVARWVKLHNCCCIDGRWHVLPQPFPEFGAAIGIGDTQAEAEEAALEHAKAVKALELGYEDSFDKLHEEILKGQACGIDWE